jgi:hypothetical protein
MKDPEKFFGALDCLENYAESRGMGELQAAIERARESLLGECRPVSVPVLDMPGLVPRFPN